MSESMELEEDEKKPVALRMSHNSKSRRLRSLVWNDFTKERRADGSYVAVCNHCKKQLTASSRSGTTHLKNHLVICTTTKLTKRKKLAVRRIILKSADTKCDAADGHEQFHFDQQLSRHDLARMIILHGYPFSIVHHVGFIRFVQNLQPQFTLLSQDVVRADCMRIYEITKIKLREVLDKISCRISLTIDSWKSTEGAEYLCTVCHYIDDDWKSKKRVLNFLHVEDLLLAEEISKDIVGKLYDWNIQKKLSSIISDNCRDSDVLGRELKKFLRPKGSLSLNGELFHVHSCAYVLNLIVHDCIDVASDLISRVRKNVQYVKSTQDRLSRFEILAKEAGASPKSLVLDVPGSWTSTYLMLETAFDLRYGFSNLADCNSDHRNKFSTEDWSNVKALVECLQVFIDAIDKFSSMRIPFANLCFIDKCGIHLLLKKWRTEPIPILATVASKMLEKFDGYWGETITLMAIACVLDPRYKMKSIEYFLKEIYDTFEAGKRIESIRKSLMNLYNEYVVRSADTSKSQDHLIRYEVSSSCCIYDGLRNDGENKTSSHVTLSDTRRGLDQYLQKASSGQPIKSDLDLYLDEAVHPSKEGHEVNFDILSWWKFNAARFPIVSVMARDILAIPLSSVSSDGEGRMLNQYLSCLDPGTVQALICAQDWLQDEFEVSLAANLDVQGCL